MKLWIANRQKRQKIELRMVRKIARETLNALGSPDAELSLSFVDDKEITQLNQQYLLRDRPTDVLAFPMREGSFSEINPHLLGDVVISLETAHRQAADKKHTLAEEVCLLLIHGILHLLGYNHETPGCDAKTMRKKEKELFRLMQERVLKSYSVKGRGQ
jgi:probable rRNA maturation factor